MSGTGRSVRRSSCAARRSACHEAMPTTATSVAAIKIEAERKSRMPRRTPRGSAAPSPDAPPVRLAGAGARVSAPGSASVSAGSVAIVIERGRRVVLAVLVLVESRPEARGVEGHSELRGLGRLHLRRDLAIAAPLVPEVDGVPPRGHVRQAEGARGVRAGPGSL